MKYVLFICLLFSTKLLAQKQLSVAPTTLDSSQKATATKSYQRPNIANPLGLIARIDSNKVVLRWMPLSFEAWQLGAKKGYDLYRRTLTRKGKRVKGDTLLLTPLPLLPLSEKAWESYGKQHEFASVAGRLLYKQGDSSPESQDFTLALAMLMTNMEKGISQGMAMLFEDKTANKEETYQYQVRIHETTYSTAIQVNPQKQTHIAAPKNLTASYADSSVFIRWEVADSLMHTAYVLERSDDGGIHFKAVSKSPILINQAPDSLGRVFVSKTDKLPRLYTYYYYRVRAITPFGELSKPSAVAQVYGHQERLPRPILKQQLLGKKAVQLQWLFPDSLAKHVLGFQLLRAESQGGTYEPLTRDLLPRNTRSFTDTLAHIQNYYKVAVLDWAGKATYSIEEFVQFEDTLAPLKPKIMVAQVDKKGIVTLRWKANSEKDLAGYTVFMGDNKKTEFSQLTKSLAKDTVFRDTLALNMLNKKIYYVVQAYDKHLNASVVSDTVLIKRPDYIAPASPNFTKVIATDSSIALSWANSASDDVISTFLLRKEINASHSCVLGAFPPSSHTQYFNDTTTLEQQEYEYSLLALDEGGLLSVPVVVRKQRMTSWVRKPIAPLVFTYDKAKKSIQIHWTAPKQPVKKYLLYRKLAGENMSIYQYFDGKYGSYTERNVQANTPYQYQLMAVYEDETESKLSPIYEAILVDEK